MKKVADVFCHTVLSVGFIRKFGPTSDFPKGDMFNHYYGGTASRIGYLIFAALVFCALLATRRRDDLAIAVLACVVGGSLFFFAVHLRGLPVGSLWVAANLVDIFFNKIKLSLNFEGRYWKFWVLLGILKCSDSKPEGLRPIMYVRIGYSAGKLEIYNSVAGNLEVLNFALAFVGLYTYKNTTVTVDNSVWCRRTQSDRKGGIQMSSGAEDPVVFDGATRMIFYNQGTTRNQPTLATRYIKAISRAKDRRELKCILRELDQGQLAVSLVLEKILTSRRERVLASSFKRWCKVRYRTVATQRQRLSINQVTSAQSKTLETVLPLDMKDHRCKMLTPKALQKVMMW
ncbi:hypothetical protein DFS33DRAFT_1277355 [Desarmillaria ectypa]|nr:hypothetical protein DFS33DRAFT_1277355 [Desarmillaria ectypa]